MKYTTVFPTLGGSIALAFFIYFLTDLQADPTPPETQAALESDPTPPQTNGPHADHSPQISLIEHEGYTSSHTKMRTNKSLEIVLAQLREFEEAKPYLQQAIYLDSETDPTAHGLMALRFLNTQNFAAAEYHYRRATETSPDTEDWQVGLALVLMEQGKYSEARQILAELRRRKLIATSAQPVS